MALGVTPHAPVTRMFRGATGSEDSPGSSRLRSPTPGLTLVRAAEEGPRRPREDPQVEARRAVLDVPDVQLDPIRPRQLGPAVDLRPAGDAGPYVQTVPLVVVVLLDLVAQRRPRADHAHLPTDDVPELWQLVERELAQQPADARDAGVSAVDREARPHRLRADDHRPELEQLEVDAVLAYSRLPVEHRAAVLQL